MGLFKITVTYEVEANTESEALAQLDCDIQEDWIEIEEIV